MVSGVIKIVSGIFLCAGLVACAPEAETVSAGHSARLGVEQISVMSDESGHVIGLHGAQDEDMGAVSVSRDGDALRVEVVTGGHEWTIVESPDETHIYRDGVRMALPSKITTDDLPEDARQAVDIAAAAVADADLSLSEERAAGTQAFGACYTVTNTAYFVPAASICGSNHVTAWSHCLPFGIASETCNCTGGVISKTCVTDFCCNG